MNAKNLEVLTNVIGAAESGGQVYGKRRYDQYSPPYHSTPKEHTITIGWACCYGHEARQLIQAIKDADVVNFVRLDPDGMIDEMLPRDWESLRWKPTAKEKAIIVALIDSPVGHKVQDALFEEKMKKLVEDCKKDYPGAGIKAQMMYCEIRHLGGRKPVNRIFDRCGGKYDLDTIMTALVADQKDTSSSNQVGDKIFWSRHVKCRQFIDQYADPEDGSGEKEKGMTEKQAIDRVIGIAEGEVGYLEKASNAKLYDKTANPGSGNYTKYNKEMHDIQPRNMDFPAAWCDAFVDWCFKEAFGADTARKVLCGNFDDYTVQSAQYYKDAGRWYSKPKRGDQAFFKNTQRICHTGIVYKVSGDTVYTIEGNAGNQVRKKSYDLADDYIAGFGRPKYSEAASEPAPEPAPAPEPEAGLTGKVRAFQRFLNDNYPKELKKAGTGELLVDGDYGKKTRAAAVAVWKHMANKYYGASLTIGNSNFLSACRAVAAKMTNAEIKKHPTLQEILNGVLAGRGFESVKAFQKAKGIVGGGEMNPDTWFALFN